MRQEYCAWHNFLALVYLGELGDLVVNLFIIYFPR